MAGAMLGARAGAWATPRARAHLEMQVLFQRTCKVLRSSGSPTPVSAAAAESTHDRRRVRLKHEKHIGKR